MSMNVNVTTQGGTAIDLLPAAHRGQRPGGQGAT